MPAPGPAQAGTVLRNGLRLLERNYLFADELTPQRLLGSALEYLEARIPQFRSRQAGSRAFALQAAGCRLRLEVAPDSDLADLETLLTRAGALLEDCGLDLGTDPPPVDSLLLNGLLSGLDPYSTVLDAKRRTEHRIHFSGRLAGIGARIGIRNDKLVLVKVYPGSPAHSAGLRDGDAVIRIDDLSATNILVSDAVYRIRGKVGTKVRLTIEREGQSDPLPITVIRGLVRIPSVETRKLDGDIAYAEITHFSQTTPNDFREQVAAMKDGQGLRGLIIDLRQNSGGSMLGASAIGDMFLSQGVLITTAGRDGHPVSGLTSEVTATADTPFAELPLAILTSPRTASGSELLAASLRNHDRAILIGERTYGKGTVQKTYNIGPDTVLKMTVGSFLPNRTAIPGNGLAPDLQVLRYTFDGNSVTVPAPKQEELPFWLRTPRWLSRPHSRDLVSMVLATGAENEDDRTLQLAEVILSRFGRVSAQETLTGASAFMSAQALSADGSLAGEMERRGLDWSTTVKERATAGAGAPLSDTRPSLVLAIDYGGAFFAGEKNTATITLTNQGTRPLYRVWGRLRSNVGSLNGRGLMFGRIQATESRKWQLDVDLPSRTGSGRIEAAVELFDDQGPLADLGPFFLAVERRDSPRLAFRVKVLQNHAGATSRTDPGHLEVEVEVENRGKASAKEVRVRLSNPLSTDFEIIEGNSVIDSIPAGSRARVTLSLQMLQSYDTVPTTELTLSELSSFSFLSSKVELEPGFSLSWQAAPVIQVARLRKSADRGYFLLARARDESGVSSILARIDGDQATYLDSDGSQKTIELELPWDPSSATRSFEVEATDSNGFTSSYTAHL